MQKQMKLWALTTGVLSVLFYVLHDIIGAMYYPGYNRMTQAVSDLTAIDAPSRIIASGFTFVYGIFTGICCAFLCVLAADMKKTLRLGIYLFTAMNAVSAIGYSLFPLTGSGYDGSFQSFVHVYVVTVLVVLLSIASLIMIAAGSFKEKRRILGILAIISLVCMFFGAVGSGALPNSIFGIVERFSTYSAVVFTGIMGIAFYD